MPHENDPLADHEASLLADLEAIRRVRKMIERGVLPTTSIPPIIKQSAQPVFASPIRPMSSDEDAPRSGEVDAAVRETVKTMSGEFNATSVLKKLLAAGQKYKRSSVRAVIRRMVPKEVRIVTQGQGRRPTTYSALNTSTP
jgi:hypothetical protein